DSSDPALRRTLTSLNERGWLAESEAEVIASTKKKYGPWLGTWKGETSEITYPAPGLWIRRNTTTILTTSLDDNLQPRVLLKADHVTTSQDKSSGLAPS